MKNRTLKLIILLLLIIILFLLVIYDIFGTSISLLSSKEIKSNRELKEDLITELKINNVDAVYDKDNNIYLYNIPIDYENNNYILKLNLVDEYKYKIVGNFLNIIKVNYDETIDVIIYNNKYYCEVKIQLTNLSIIEINTDENISDEDVESTFKYINQSNPVKTIESNNKIHVRGSSSRNIEKKSYKLNFYDSKYEDKLKINIPGFYYGDAFILDAVYRDSSKIRNVLSMDMWNLISSDFNNIKMNNEFVELFINGEYRGLYVLTEPVNRKKFELDKSSSSDTSAIIKQTNWININKDTKYKDIDTESYSGLEIKYPNNSDLYSDVWEKLISTIADYYDENIDITDEIISNTFNVKNYADIMIFNSFTNNVDNCLGYNNYFYFNNLNGEIFIQPWDMEFSYGYYLKPSMLSKLEYDKTVCNLIESNSPKINEKIIKRYWELRKNILTEEYFDKLIDDYLNKLNRGAAKRDADRWSNYDINIEIENVREWIHNRFSYFDNYVKELQYE